MSALEEARKALNVELEYLRKRTEKVAAALDALNAVDQDTTKAKGKKGRTSTNLPDTSGDWFFDLLTTMPAQRKDLLEAAALKAGGNLQPDARTTLGNRLDAALTRLHSNKRIIKTKDHNGITFAKAI